MSGAYVCVCVCACIVLPVDPIYATALIQTGHDGTFINVDFTVSALEASHALTCICGDMILAGGTVLAGMHLTFINLHLTVNPYSRQCRDGRQPRCKFGKTTNYFM